MNETLFRLGFTEAFAHALRDLSDDSLLPVRVLAVNRGAVVVDGAWRGSVRVSDADVAVGDWLAVRPGADGAATLVAVLPRATVLARQAPGRRTERQVLAANVDVVLVTMSMNADLSVRRVERYVAAARSGGADVVVVFTKADLDLANARRYTSVIPDDVPVIVTSAELDLGVDELRARVAPGVTAALVGSSGVGKSTLVNRLLGATVAEVLPIRADETGRHTTTRRELFEVPGGGLLVDTPGLRELALWDGAGVDLAFPEIEALSADCRFRDCGHDTEPGCAVTAAIEAGTLTEDRVRSWRKLQREAARQEARAHELRREHRRFTKMVGRVHRDKVRR